MLSLIWQITAPLLSASLIVILITIVAERYGTKIGGIFGTLPSTMTIAYIFISLNQSTDFASEAAVVVPATMGVNIVFLLIFISVIPYGFPQAIIASLSLWGLCSIVLYFAPINNIFTSCLIYVVLMVSTFIFIEKYKKIKSQGKVNIIYTHKKIIFRGIFAGIMITVAVMMTHINEVVSGIFSVFPSIFLSTMVICAMEHGPQFTTALGKSMIFGTPTVISYAISIHFLYPLLSLFWGTIVAYGISLVVVGILFLIKEKIL